MIPAMVMEGETFPISLRPNSRAGAGARIAFALVREIVFVPTLLEIFSLKINKSGLTTPTFN
jgi:hypothetical protein